VNMQVGKLIKDLGKYTARFVTVFCFSSLYVVYSCQRLTIIEYAIVGELIEDLQNIQLDLQLCSIFF
jgi:hypothetical protein